MAQVSNIAAGRLRHRVSIDRKIETQDETGDPVAPWEPWAENVPAAIEPARGAEFAGVNQILGRAVVLIFIRWRPGLVATMRIRHGETVYNIQDVVADWDSGRDHLRLTCYAGTNEG